MVEKQDYIVFIHKQLKHIKNIGLSVRMIVVKRKISVQKKEREKAMEQARREAQQIIEDARRTANAATEEIKALKKQLADEQAKENKKYTARMVAAVRAYHKGMSDQQIMELYQAKLKDGSQG